MMALSEIYVNFKKKVGTSFILLFLLKMDVLILSMKTADALQGDNLGQDTR